MGKSAYQNQTVNNPVEITPQRRLWHEIPMVLFYVPVFFAIVIMMIRYRSFSAALNANWALKKGGLFPESKDEFTKRFAPDSKLLPKSVKLDGTLTTEEAIMRFERFDLSREDGSLPFVLKPDDGIQGKAIHILRDKDQLVAIWQGEAHGNGDWLLQDYVGGVETAVFYVRENPDAAGRLLSMTWKHGFEVIGDGNQTISELVGRKASDEATRKRVLKFNLHRLEHIPGDQEVVDLIPVRNHHLGATFQDVSDCITPALEDAICSELDAIEGYNFGRLDIRAPSFGDLFEGKNIKVLEANALYSEPVHAYDPKYSLGDAYGIFINYWALAMRTGIAHKK